MRAVVKAGAALAGVGIIMSAGAVSVVGTPSQDVTEPKVGPVERLREPHGHLRPPPDGVEPAVPAVQARRTAWEQEPPAGGAEFVKATFAILELPGERATPVWVITYEGACIYGNAAARTDPEVPEPPLRCAEREWNVILDAGDGSFLQAHTDRPNSF